MHRPRAAVCLLSSRLPGSLEPTQIGLALLTGLLFGLIPVGLAVLMGRVLGRIQDPTAFLHSGRVVAALAVLAVGWAAAFRPDWLRRALPALLIAGQLGLPVFFLTLLPARLESSGEVVRYATTPRLTVLVLGLLVWGVVDVARRHLTRRNEARSPAGAVSPVAFFALLVALRFGLTYPPDVPPDDYHFGEVLLGWAYLRPGLPYVDYLPVHGLVSDDLPGVIPRSYTTVLRPA